jgi:hypothetical protein
MNGINLRSQLRPGSRNRVLRLDDLSLDYELADFIHGQAQQKPQTVMRALGDALLDENLGWKLRISGVGSLLDVLPVPVVMEWLGEHGVSGARVLARSLRRPSLSAEGKPSVPALTEQVLERFDDDGETQREFVCGSGVRTYSGDIAGQHDDEARFASQFLGHRLCAVREWARVEKSFAEHDAKRHRQEDAEMLIPK